MENLAKRPLMPYELRLCSELGITEDEYKQFLDAMQSEVARKPLPGDKPTADFVSVAIYVIGTLFQVIGALLSPQQRQQGGRGGSRAPGEALSPAYGFNSLQELSRIGEVIPQVYCDKSANSLGGVRVNTKLVWSQVESRGAAQLGKFLSIISDGSLVDVDFNATGIGGSILKSVATTSSWQYYVQNNLVTGSIQGPFQFLYVRSTTPSASTWIDPSLPSYYVPKGTSKVTGTSQAYTPNSSNTFGISAPIPIANVTSYISDGARSYVYNQIKLDSNSFSSLITSGDITSAIGSTTINITFYRYIRSTSGGVELRNQQNLSLVQSLDPSSFYIFGRAILRMLPFSPGSIVDTRAGISSSDDTGEDVTAQFSVIEATDASGGRNGRLIFTSEWALPLVDDGTFNSTNLRGTKQKNFTFIAAAQLGRFSTISRVDAIEFSIKARIAGELQNPASELNGMRPRTAFFRCRYRKLSSQGGYIELKHIFAYTRSSRNERFFFIRLEFPERDNYEVEFIPIIDWNLQYIDNKMYIIRENASLCVDENAPTITPGVVTVCFQGEKYDGTNLLTGDNTANLIEREFKASSGNWRSDHVYRINNDAKYTYEEGAEFEVIAVNEIQYDNKQGSYYTGLAMLGLNLYGGKTRQDASQISVFVNRGKRIKRLNSPTSEPSDASNRFPDIFFDTLTDSKSGLGNLISEQLVDKASLYSANRFVQANSFYWDGVIDGEQNWREWASEQAGFSLLQLTIKDGRFGLQPVVPFNSATGAISLTGFTIKALFNESNILSDSYTETISAAEDSSSEIITVRYRELRDTGTPTSTRDTIGFPVERSVSWRLLDSFGGSSNDKEIIVNAASSVTTKAQADKIAQYLIAAKRYENRNISFKTAEPWMNLAPGDVIRVDTTFTAFQLNYAGRVLSDGTVDIYGYDGSVTSSGSALIYRPDLGIQSINVTAGQKVSSSFAGSLIAIGSTTVENRLWTITSIELDEEGIASISAKLFPIRKNQTVNESLIAHALINPSLYMTEV